MQEGTAVIKLTQTLVPVTVQHHAELRLADGNAKGEQVIVLPDLLATQVAYARTCMRGRECMHEWVPARCLTSSNK